MKYKSADQFKAMFSLSTLLAIYQSNAASARDAFFHDKKKSGNGGYGAFKLKKAIVLSHGQKTYPIRINTAKYWEHGMVRELGKLIQ